VPGVKEWVELYLHSPNTPSWRVAQLGKAQGRLNHIAVNLSAGVILTLSYTTFHFTYRVGSDSFIVSVQLILRKSSAVSPELNLDSRFLLKHERITELGYRSLHTISLTHKLCFACHWCSEDNVNKNIHFHL
jgi:hypothetical protein